MTNFEKIMSEMTVEKLAELRVVNMEDFDYTTDGIYYFYDDALKAEIEWLQQEVDNVD